jgi:hypothetical protein
LKAPRVGGIFPDAQPVGFSVLQQWTNDDRARREDILNHPLVIAEIDIPDEVANRFHAVENEYSEQIEDLIRLCEDADQERDTITEGLANLEKKLYNKEQALVAKQAECGRLAQPQQASDDVTDQAAPPLVDDATARELAKLKREVTVKNALNKSMQARLGAALQEVEATKKALATAEDERDMTSEKMELAMVELNATNEALIRVKASSTPSTTSQININNRLFNIKMTGLPTYDCTRTLEAVTSFIFTLHRHFGPRAQELGLTDQLGIPLTNGWAAAALLQFRDKAAVWANHRFPAHASAGVAWKDFSVAVKEAFIPPDTVTRLKRDWESL